MLNEVQYYRRNDQETLIALLLDCSDSDRHQAMIAIVWTDNAVLPSALPMQKRYISAIVGTSNQSV